MKSFFSTPHESDGEGRCEKHGLYATTLIQLPGSDRKMPGPCPECDVIQIADRRKVKARQSMHEVSRKLERAGIPKRFRSKHLADYIPANSEQSKALAVAKKYASNFEERYASAGCLVFSGGCGTGKTHLACGIANRIIADGYSCMFTTVIEAVRLVRSTYGGKSAMTESQAIQLFARPDLLILDEVGMQHGSDNEFLILTELINLRYADEKPTIMLSNLSPEKFEAFVGRRVFDRMHENCGMVLQVSGQSYRRKTKQETAYVNA